MAAHHGVRTPVLPDSLFGLAFHLATTVLNRQRRKTTQIEELLKTHFSVPSTPLHEPPFTLETPVTEAPPLSEWLSIVQEKRKKEDKTKKNQLLNAQSDHERNSASVDIRESKKERQ